VVFREFVNDALLELGVPDALPEFVR